MKAYTFLTKFFKTKSNEQTIVATNEKGETVHVPCTEWRTRVLPKQLQKNWNYAQGLADDIAYALQDNFAPEVMDATLRLLEIDIIPERAHVLRAIALMETGKLDDAETVLKQFHKTYQKTAASLINLAKIISKKGELQNAEVYLWEGLQIDPNTEEGIRWYTELQRDRFGDVGYRKALEELCKLKGAWRPFLWLARFELSKNNNELAMNLYNNLFRISEEFDRALLMISADLGEHGFIKELVELIPVQYIAEKHDPRIGFNILKAYKQLEMNTDIAMLIEHMRHISQADVQHELDAFEKEMNLTI